MLASCPNAILVRQIDERFNREMTRIMISHDCQNPAGFRSKRNSQVSPIVSAITYAPRFAAEKGNRGSWIVNADLSFDRSLTVISPNLSHLSPDHKTQRFHHAT